MPQTIMPLQPILTGITLEALWAADISTLWIYRRPALNAGKPLWRNIGVS
ncbi:hypothetical protein [Acetonema longum]|nr:hypothetical protein [Acetonema longum]